MAARAKGKHAAPELALERVPLASIVPYATNARLHGEAQMAALVKSIEANGFAFPLVVDDVGNLIAGHARLEAAKRLGWSDVPVVRLSGCTPEQVRALRLADNRIPELGSWDEDALARELAELRAIDVDLGSIGFDEAQVRILIRGLEEEDSTDAADAPVDVDGVAITQPGDLWELGPHRLLCGDATNADDVALVLFGVKPAIMVTDPPYGVDYEPGWRNGGGIGRRAFGAAVEEQVQNDGQADWGAAWALFPGDVAYVWHAALRGVEVAAGLDAAGFERRAQIVWVKQTPIVSRDHYHWQHEPCWYAVREGATATWRGDRKQSTVWNVNTSLGYSVDTELDARVKHGTQKPCELVLRALRNHTDEGAIVYDPFVGSGTTIVAAGHIGRRCYALDIDPRCVDVALRRWRRITGLQPTRHGVELVDLEGGRN